MEQLSAARDTEVFLELIDLEEIEDNRIETFAAQGCSCTSAVVIPCWDHFSRSLSRNEDMVHGDVKG